MKRVRVREAMDAPDLEPKERKAALDGIEEISHWMGQRQPLLRAILGLLGLPSSRRFKLIEVGAGSGHLSRWISTELARRGYRADVVATDLVAVPGVEKLDCLRSSLPQADIYFSSLLLHHLKDTDLSRMLRLQMKKARMGYAHFDLHRHPVHYYAAMIRIKLAGLHPINFKDGLASIRQGYTRSELEALSPEEAVISWNFPFRWLVTWRR